MTHGGIRRPGAANFLNDSTGTFNGTVAELNNACDLIGGFSEQAAINSITYAQGTANDTMANLTLANFAQGMADVNAVANALNANVVTLVPILQNDLQTATTKINSILAALRLANIIADA